MLSTVSEKRLQTIRWVIFLAWALLIVSLFYDPVSAVLTHPENTWSPLADEAIALAQDPMLCVKAHADCVIQTPYAIGTRVFWGMVIPSAIFIVLVFGHEFWRRICPLYFFSQLPRALGMKPLLDVQRNQWLQENHSDIQFMLFFLGITARILLVNSVRPVAGLFFIATLLLAAGVVTLYGGRSWCHYVCPFGMVQAVFTGPRGLLDSSAHTAEPYSITQSMCRTVDGQGQEQSACVSCKAACMDIDSEQSYWANLHKPGRQWVQYGYLGLVIGYFCYYILYAGNFRYYFSGVWSHDSGTLDTLLAPGFYIGGQAIAIPKLIAAPFTLMAFAAASYWICTRLERYYRGYLKQKDPTASAEKSLHRVFSLCTFIAFNFFFIYGGRPEINRLPIPIQFGFQALIVLVSSLWLSRTWGRSSHQYEIEKLAGKKRKQLRKLPVNISALLRTDSLEDLGARELNVLTQVLPQVMLNQNPLEGSNKVSVDQTSTDRTSANPDGLNLPQTLLKRKPLNFDQDQNVLPKTRMRRQ